MRKAIITKFNRIYENALSSTVAFCSALVLILVVSVSYDVGARYFFNKPTGWTTETAAFIILFLSFLSAGYILKQDLHVRMDLIYDALKSKNKNILDILASFFSMIVCAIVVWRGTIVTIELFSQKTLTLTTMQVVQWPFMAVIPIGMFFFLIEYMRKFIRAVSQLMGKNIR